MRRSNQLSCEVTDAVSWSFVGSNVPVMNESTNKIIYEMNHILKLQELRPSKKRVNAFDQHVNIKIIAQTG